MNKPNKQRNKAAVCLLIRIQSTAYKLALIDSLLGHI